MAKKHEKDPIGAEMGRRMRAARKARGWSIEAFAGETGWTPETPRRGLHPSTIAMYERGERRVAHEVAAILQQHFGQTIAYWLAAADEYESGVLTAIRQHPQRVSTHR